MKDTTKLNHFLVVGASGVAGRKATEAIRILHPDARITTTISRPVPDSGPEAGTLYSVDLAAAGAVQRIKDGIEFSPDAIVYCPAFGMVGYPAAMAPVDQVDDALRFSVLPFMELLEVFSPKVAVGFSSYYWLRSLEVAYGSMAYAKLALERLAVSSNGQLRIVRAGLFPSQSLRGICIMIQSAIKKASFEDTIRLAEEWRASGLSFPEFFMDFARRQERESLADCLKGAYQPTAEEDLVPAIRRALEPDAAAIVNVVGPDLWEEHELNHVPAFITGNTQAFARIAHLSLQGSSVAR